MLSPQFVRPAGFIVGAGTALTAFGIAAPAHATVDCSTGVTVNADELAIREAISDGESLICVNPGTIDLSSAGFGGAEAINIDGQNLHLVALGDVTFDGGDEADNAILSFGTSDEDLTIDGFTFSNFDNPGGNAYPAVMLDGSSGTLTVLNSTFTGNFGYGVIGATDFDEDDLLPNVVVDNSVFDTNSSVLGTVWAYGDVVVSNSTFIGEENSSPVINGGYQDLTKTTVLYGNYFEGNSTESSTVEVDGESNAIYNNTFVNNYSVSDSEGSVITFAPGAGGSVAFNTFAGNDSDYDNANLFLVDANNVVFHGNVFDLTVDEVAVEGTNATVTDGGGNFSTNELDETFFSDDTSVSGATSDELDLQDAADNGGSTWTMALGANSIARNVLDASLVANELGPDLDWDQRGEARGDLVDSGAWDDGTSELASTGVDATGIALTGGLIGAAGVALVARRRRSA